MIIRRPVFDSTGPLDAAYFMYYEEVDFCLQARRAGWPCWYVPDSRVVHLVGQSSGLNSAAPKPKRLPAYWFQSRRRYFTKNHGPLYAALTDLTWALAHITWRLRRPLQRKPDTDPPHLLTDFLRHSPLLHPLRAQSPRPKLSAHPHNPPLNPTPI
jgi:GT2 family glycosyltransferase